VTLFQSHDIGANHPKLGVGHVVAVGAGSALGFYDFLVFSFFSAR
jgi:hypothetical protein